MIVHLGNKTVMNMKSEARAVCDKLVSHRDILRQTPMRALFADDSHRFEKLSRTLGDLLFDYSKNHVDEHALALLIELATKSGITEQRAALFAGERINTTENRAVMHMALRNLSGTAMRVDGHDVMPDILKVLSRMKTFADAVRDGTIAGIGGAFSDIVNIGIGGSDLGPVMVSQALYPYCDGPKLHFVSNIDGADLHDTLAGLNPATTMFIIASKTFTTQETMTNARSARQWLSEALGDKAVARHFAALSTNLEATRAFGITDDRAFGFWDWVGGRYSVWSAIGLSVMIGIGAKNFEAFLAGAHALDKHFENEPLATNIPVLMAVLGVWHRNICGYGTQAILPYAQHLHRFPAYLQQLDMESNGKRVCHDGSTAEGSTGPVVWGEPGTNGQHAFYQLLHQGTDIIPADFLVAVNPNHTLGDHHEKLVANCLAQSEAMMMGKTLEEANAELVAAGLEGEAAVLLAPHKVFPGNRPSNTLMFPELTPHMLGMLIALYEHKIFVQGVIWNINSFDQWGVELGKSLAGELLPMVKGETAVSDKDASTSGLLGFYHAKKT